MRNAASNQAANNQAAQTLSPFQTRTTEVSPMLNLVITLAVTATLALSAFAFNTEQVQVGQAVQDSQSHFKSYDSNFLMADDDNWTGG